jgi:NAD(P)-dependent dehydrogenase (short-subunit alcohol dehydrogenase family)
MLSTILVTGSNKGIGYEAVKLLSLQQPDATILLGSRSIQNGNEAIERMKSSDLSHPFTNIKVLELDITAPSSLASAVEHIRSTYHTLDFLIHNSGISELNGDIKHPAIFDVNVRGTKATIDAFLPILTPHTGKITVVSSQVGSWYQHGVNDEIRKEFEDIDNVTWEKVEGWMQDWEKFAAGKQSKAKWIPLDEPVGTMYMASKGMLNPWLRNFAKTHKEIQLAVVCPGYCATDLNGFAGTRPAEKGGESIIWPTFNEFESGKFYYDGKEVGYDQPVFAI